MSCTIPIIRDDAGDFSYDCPESAGLKELEMFHRTLPVFQTINEDPDVLQDEDGEAILDEQTNSYIYDNWK